MIPIWPPKGWQASPAHPNLAREFAIRSAKPEGIPNAESSTSSCSCLLRAGTSRGPVAVSYAIKLIGALAKSWRAGYVQDIFRHRPRHDWKDPRRDRGFPLSLDGTEQTGWNPPTQRMLDPQGLSILQKALESLGAGFSELPEFDNSISSPLAIERVLIEVAGRLRDNYPYFHPLYAGQMLKPPHPVARLAYALALSINPNNHALDGGRASSAMEKEAVAELARMVGWETHLGHLCSGGTMANLEALWIAGQLAPGKKVVASRQAHYTHRRISQVLKLEFEEVACDQNGRIDAMALEKLLQNGNVGTVVATLGTTAAGAVDPLEDIIKLRDRYGFRLHADAAYGGYFCLAENLAAETQRRFQRLGEADSIVIDPHKHGLQPYGCGCVLFRDPVVGRFYRHDSPYTYFTSDVLHLGEISLECSRPGAAAAALWATQRLLPPIRGGEFAAMLGRCHEAAMALFEKLRGDNRWLTAFPPDLDIVVWLPRADRVTAASKQARRIFAEAARQNLHLALANLPVEFFDIEGAGMNRDAETVTCLRSVLMKPEHADWIDRIWEILNRADSRE